MSQPEHEPSAYIGFLRSAEGGAVLVVAAVLLVGALFFWACQRGHADRFLVLGTAAVLMVLVACVSAIALWAGWWTGSYFTLPLVIQAAILLPLSMLFGTLWLAGFRWVADHTRQPVQIYVAVSLLLVLAVAVAHRLSLSQGQILVGPGYALVIEAVLGVLILWIPLLVYESLRRSIERFEPIP